MNKNILKTVFFLLCLIFLIPISANAEFVHYDDFQSYPITDSFGSTIWKTSGIELKIESDNSNKYLSCDSSAQHYIQSNNYIDMANCDTVVSFGVKAATDASKLTVSLRGLGSDNLNNIKLFESVGNSASFFETKRNLQITDKWIYVTFYFDNNENVYAYVDGELVGTLTDYRSSYPEFNKENTMASLRLYLSNDAYVDDIVFYDNISINKDVLISSPVYKINTEASDNFAAYTYPIDGIKKGDIDAYIPYTFLDGNKITIGACLYDNNVMKGIKISSYTSLSNHGIIKAELPSDIINAGETIRLFSLSDLADITPLTSPYMCDTPKYIRIYPSELEKSFAKSGVHPRIMTDSDHFKSLAEKYTSGDKWCIQLVAKADDILQKNKLPSADVGATNILATSREVLDQIMTLSCAYHMTKDSRYLSFAENILKTVCDDSFGSWCRSSHFFSCAEMSAAVSIGYDWLYNDLTNDTKTLIEEKIYTNTIEYAYDKYQNRILGSTFFTGSGNKNLVYNGAMAVTSLAFAELYPTECFSIISESFECIPEALKSYAPHGAWYEGTNYWRYATNYLTMMLKSYETVYDTDFGISSFEGLDKTMNFIVSMKGTNGYNNFHDSDYAGSDTAALLYLSKLYNSKDIAAARLKLLDTDITKLEPLDLIYYDDTVNGGSIEKLPLDSYFKGVEAMSMRSSWDDEALFVSAHGGKNSGSHTHIDAGSFVFDYLGERWIIDLGREPLTYNSETSAGSESYYRISAHGHNVFVINPQNEPIGQDIDADVKIASHEFGTKQSKISYNMQSAYKSYADTATREFRLTENKTKFKINDYISWSSGKEQNIEWYFHTRAQVSINEDGIGFTLKQNDKTILLKIEKCQVDSVDALPSLDVEPAKSPTGQASNDGVSRIKVSVTPIRKAMLTFTFQLLDE